MIAIEIGKDAQPTDVLEDLKKYDDLRALQVNCVLSGNVFEDLIDGLLPADNVVIAELYLNFVHHGFGREAGKGIWDITRCREAEI